MNAEERRGFSIVLTRSVGSSLVWAAWLFGLAFAPFLKVPALISLVVFALVSTWLSWGEGRHVDSLLAAAASLFPELVEGHSPYRLWGVFYRPRALEALANEPALAADPRTSEEAAWVRGAARAWRYGLVALLPVVSVLSLWLAWILTRN